MLKKRLVACLDVRGDVLVKSVRFANTQELGSVLGRAKQYAEEGIDELVFYDITASSDRRNIMLDTVERVAAEVFIPFSVGGGIRSVDDATALRLAGAEKVNVNSAAIARPELVSEIAHAIGTQSTVVSMDVLWVDTQAQPSGYEIVSHGGRLRSGLDALAWAKRAEALGAGELVVNSIDRDGTKAGYDLSLTQLIVGAVQVPVVASGGAGQPEDVYDVLVTGRADAAIVASIVHYGQYRVSEIKRSLLGRGLHIRMTS
jgi:cyclase